jgi:Mrp family chromosome partitioning ATPase
MSKKLDELIEHLRSQYQYIIIDNVPMDLVADASITNRLADVTVYIVRAGVTHSRFVQELNEQYEENKFKAVVKN